MEQITKKEGKEIIRISSVGKISNDRLQRIISDEGFTLLELILVLAFMGLIAGLTTPFVMNTLERVERKSQVEKLVTTLRLTRSKAITTKTRYAFAADMENNNFWIQNLKTEETSNLGKLKQGIKFKTFRDNVDEVDKGKFYIIFYPQGNASGGSMLMEAKDSGETEEWFEVSVDPVTGKPEFTSSEK
jgi:type II secretion system protein H